MSFIKEYKSIICILLIAIFVFTFSTVVTSATIDEMDAFEELGAENNTSEDDEVEDIPVVEDKNKNTASEEDDDEDVDESVNDIKDSVGNKENAKVENQNTSTNSLSKAGIEDTPGILIIALFVIASVYAYIKTKNA